MEDAEADLAAATVAGRAKGADPTAAGIRRGNIGRGTGGPQKIWTEEAAIVAAWRTN